MKRRFYFFFVTLLAILSFGYSNEGLSHSVPKKSGNIITTSGRTSYIGSPDNTVIPSAPVGFTGKKQCKVRINLRTKALDNHVFPALPATVFHIPAFFWATQNAAFAICESNVLSCSLHANSLRGPPSAA